MDRSANHQSLGVEARALLDVLAEKLQAAAATVPDLTEPDGSESDGSESEAAADHPTRCAGCPVCATLTYLTDHRELSTQLAQGALLIVGALRQYLEQPPSTPSTPSTPWTRSTPTTPSTQSTHTAPSPASVQRIDIT
jgi:hypothetical protein